MYILKLIYQKIENCIIIIDNNNIYIFSTSAVYIGPNSDETGENQGLRLASFGKALEFIISSL